MSLVRFSPEELKVEPPEVKWIIRNLVAQGAMTLLAGEGGLGKSSLALALCSAAAHMSLYGTYAGFEINRAPIAYIDGENGAAEIHRRAKSFHIFEDIYIFEGDMLDCMDQLEDAMVRVRFGMVVLDSFRTLFPSVEENDTKSVMPALKGIQEMARAYHCGVLILHHTDKAGISYRGSSEFQNRPEIVCQLRRDATYGHRFIDWRKMRIGLEPERHHLRISNGNGAMLWEHSKPAPKGEPADWNVF